MTTIKRFEDLECWKEVKSFVRLIYELVKKQSFDKDLELVRQVKKSAISPWSQNNKKIHIH
jgi:hypothetical protein